MKNIGKTDILILNYYKEKEIIKLFVLFSKCMSRGKRYNGEQKLNVKKVIASVLVLVVLIMVIVLINKLLKNGSGKKTNEKIITNSYISVYTNGKWGVINSKGEYVIEPQYDNMVVIPDASKEIFIYQSNVDLEKNTFDSKAIDAKLNNLFGNYQKVEAVQRLNKDGSISYDNNVLKVSNDSKYGLINFNGTELLPCEYDSIEPIKYIKNSFETVKDGKKGVVDNSGSIIVENKYNEVAAVTEKYEDGYIVKDSNNKYGLINYNKKQVLECKYDKIQNVCGNDMYVVKSGNELQIVKNGGEVVTKSGFDEVAGIDTNIVIKKSGKFGIISSTGESLVNPTYSYIKYLFDGKYIAAKDDKYGVIDLNNQTIIDFKYTGMTYMSEEGFIEADVDYTNTELLDINFAVKAKGIVSEINTNHKFVKVRVGDTYKYYDFQLQEKSVKDFYPANTLYLSKQNGKYGFVDKNGIVIVDYIYDDATEQNDYGYAAVKKDGKWGTIDSTGKVTVEPQYELMQNPVISFIGKWHLAPDLNANYYTDTNE